VVWPHSTAEVVEIVNLCREHRVPLIPFGVGSSLEGHILATRGGLSLDMSEMNQVLAIHGEDMDAVVQPGVTRKALNAALHGSGLFFPSTRAPTRRWAAWCPPAPRAPTPCATAPCARTCWPWKWCSPTAGSSAPAAAPASRRPATT
jgi:hypothetical protein